MSVSVCAAMSVEGMGVGEKKRQPFARRCSPFLLFQRRAAEGCRLGLIRPTFDIRSSSVAP